MDSWWRRVRGSILMPMSDPIIRKPLTYIKYDGKQLWWCNSHQRKAEYLKVSILDVEHCCDPKLGGNLLPCRCVNLTGMVEIEDGL